MTRAASAIAAVGSKRLRIATGAVLLVAIGVLVVLLVTRGGGDAAPPAAPAPPVARPHAMSESALRAFARMQQVPVYWAGARDNVTYELTVGAAGGIFIRYLPHGVRVGVRRADYLSIGSYPDRDGYQLLRDVGRRKGEVSRTTASRALVVYQRNRPTNVYFAFPGRDLQVEVYSPTPGEALRLVLDGEIQQLR